MRILAPCFVAFWLFLAPAPARAGEPVGAVHELAGSATIIHAGEAAAHAVAADAPVFPKDVIESADDAHFKIKFSDGTELVMSGRGKLTVDDFAYDPKRPAENKSALSLAGAAFSYVSGLVDKGAAPNATLNLDYGSIGIRGTKILGAFANGSDMIYLEDGNITVDNQGGQVIMHAGDGTSMASKAEAPAAPYAFTAEDIAMLRHLVDDPAARRSQAMASNLLPPSKAKSEMAAADMPAAPAGGGGAANEMQAKSLDELSSARASGNAAAAPAAPAAPAEASAPAAASAPAKVMQAAPQDIITPVPLSPAALGTKISAEGEGVVRIETLAPATINLMTADISAQHLEETVLRFHAQMKAKNFQGKAYLEMEVHYAGASGGPVADSLPVQEENWKEFQALFTLKKGASPDRVTLNLILDGRGTVWIKGARLQR